MPFPFFIRSFRVKDLLFHRKKAPRNGELIGGRTAI